MESAFDLSLLDLKYENYFNAENAKSAAFYQELGLFHL